MLILFCAFEPEPVPVRVRTSVRTPVYTPVRTPVTISVSVLKICSQLHLHQSNNL